MTNLAQQIRDAVSAGEYPRAAGLFEDYARSEGVTPEDLKALMDWARIESRCTMAHARDRLEATRQAVHVATAYRQS